MTTRTLVVLSGARDAAHAGRLSRLLPGAWPLGTGPVVEVATLETASRDLLRNIDGVILIPDREADRSSGNPHLRIIDLAHDTGRPVVVVGEFDGDGDPELESIQVPYETSPTTIASILCGMMSRQPELDRLHRRLSLATRVVENVNNEMAKLDEELQSAAVVQRDFLPASMPGIGEISVAALWRPTSYVSGDFYDVREIDERHLGVFLADAAGHGVPSAMMTMILARAFECAFAEHPDDPARVMEAINRDFHREQAGITRFATGVYAVVDCEVGEIRYCSAGHPPPLILDETALRVLDTERGGGLLGIFPDERYEVMVEPLRAGEAFLIHSDGFEQAFPLPTAGPNELDRPTNAYLNVFKSLGEAGDPEALVDRLTRVIEARRGSLHPSDDLTLLCVQRASCARPAGTLGLRAG